MNFLIITILSLLLVGPFNLGMAVSGNGDCDAKLGETSLVLQSHNDDEVSVTQTLGPNGGTISVDFQGELRTVAFAPGALLRDVEVKVKVSATPATDYYDPDLLESYPPNLLDYPGPNVKVELPTDALDWQRESVADVLIAIYAVSVSGYTDEGIDGTELRIALPDVTNGLSFNSFFLNDLTPFIAAFFQANYLRSGVPATTVISLQVVDETRIYSDLDGSN